MAKSKQDIISTIKAHISSRGGGYKTWYVGVSSDAVVRLFTDHKVRRKGDKWIYRTAGSSKVAREIEDYFVNSCKTDGGTGGGDETATKVYAYKKAPHTDP